MTNGYAKMPDNTAQIEFWNGDAGEKWVQYATLLDHLLAPFIPAILGKADLKPGERVLDVGCGGGALSLAADDHVGPDGKVMGVDISQPLLALAARRSQNANKAIDFVEVDASAYRSDSPIDVAISRFGVMFFADPVSAFASLRKTMASNGRLAFAAWQGIRQNEWLTTPLDVATPFFRSMPDPPPPHAPGPFAFADADYVTDVLKKAGWFEVMAEPWTGTLSLPGDSIEAQATFILKMGPVARLIAEQVDDATPILEALIDRLSGMKSESGDVELGASAWIVSASVE